MLSIREVNDLEGAEKLWCALSPNKTIFDEWDFRYCFYKYAPLPLKFLAAYEGEELVGLMPLQIHPKHGFEFFAEDPCEENRPFIKFGYEKIIPDLYKAITGPGKAYDITGDDEFTTKFDLEDYKYVLPLKGINNFNDFLESRLEAKRRRSLIKEIETVENNQIISEVINDRDGLLKYLEILFNFNTENFKEESYLLKNDQAPWRDLMSIEFNWQIVILKVKDTVQAVSLSVLHNNEWHYLITGTNFKDYPGIGKLLVKINIEEAIKNKADYFDAGLGDCGWKHLWHFDKIEQYLFIKEK
ncbi:MAG: GNAT family N-acetyltransferase [Patescibacteria group bacterium]